MVVPKPKMQDSSPPATTPVEGSKPPPEKRLSFLKFLSPDPEDKRRKEKEAAEKALRLQKERRQRMQEIKDKEKAKAKAKADKKKEKERQRKKAKSGVPDVEAGGADAEPTDGDESDGGGQKDWMDDKIKDFFSDHPELAPLTKAFIREGIRYDHMLLMNRRILQEDFGVTDEKLLDAFMEASEELDPMTRDRRLKDVSNLRLRLAKDSASPTIHITQALAMSREASMRRSVSRNLITAVQTAFTGVNDPEAQARVQEQRLQRRTSRAASSNGQGLGSPGPTTTGGISRSTTLNGNSSPSDSQNPSRRQTGNFPIDIDRIRAQVEASVIHEAHPAEHDA